MNFLGKDKINILYISYDGMTDQLGQSQVIPYLKELTRLGNFNFILLSCEKKENFHKNKKIVEETLKGFPIEWKPRMYHKSPPVLSTLFDVIMLHYHARKLYELYKFRLVHCRSYISTLVGLSLWKKYGVPFIFDMRGFWADERVDGKLWNLKNPFYRIIYRYFKNKEAEFLANASGVISLTEAGKAEMMKWENGATHAHKMVVIPCCVDLEHFSAKKLDQTLISTIKEKNHIKEEDFVLTYLGAIGTWYMLPEMLRFFYLLQQQKQEAKFLFIAPSDSHAFIRGEARNYNIPSEKLIFIHGQRKEIPSLLSLSSYSIYFITPSYSKISSSPTKQAEIMAMGIPSVTNKGIGDTEEIIRNAKAGFITEDFSEKSFQKIIEQIFHEPVAKTEIRDGAEHYYSLVVGSEKYYKLYQKILSKEKKEND